MFSLINKTKKILVCISLLLFQPVANSSFDFETVLAEVISPELINEIKERIGDDVSDEKAGELFATELFEIIKVKKNPSGAELFFLALMNVSGEIGVADNKKALELAEKAANKGHVAANTFVGMAYFEGFYAEKNPRKSIKHFTVAAEGGDVTAQTFLAKIYYLGEFFPKNDKLSIKWMKAAAEQNSLDAKFLLANQYGTGEIIDKDTKKAANLYLETATGGLPIGQYLLSISYFEGNGIPKNYIKGYVWALMARAQGFEVDAIDNLIDLYKKEMAKEQIAKAQEIASKCFSSNYTQCE